ncbi:hypothetical protein K490DRAFT_62800 [Saccharata proteae CBS 121410]|uniref:Altered inheritance of mitochondria protein 6 n=1 Tax=Saccharata proteae CBS 121410 TaxID=1314787 RepID=A0A9P4LY53_9PEZI|nr:hypothetical protein K490DRAFT_62800 [Saccharata proteae CBS 121410]
MKNIRKLSIHPPTRIHIALVTALISHLRPPTPLNGLHAIVTNWREPTSPTALNTTSLWAPEFSRDIVPRPIHSHNDYWRRVPLYLALLNGASSIEADIWQHADTSDLLVGHTASALRPARTLNTLYLSPLMEILTRQNAAANTNINTTTTAPTVVGVFDTSPTHPLVLLLDVKTPGPATWPLILSHLAPLHAANYLTRWNGTTLIPGPITVVGSGNTPFELLNSAEFGRDRFVFFDAPLGELGTGEKEEEGGKYGVRNSYYASGRWGQGWLDGARKEEVKRQVAGAKAKGLRARYWGTPGWPVSTRDSIWSFLVSAGVGVLNVDDVEVAGRWNWSWCSVAGLTLCGNDVHG